VLTEPAASGGSPAVVRILIIHQPRLSVGHHLVARITAWRAAGAG
jgi:hypothetical protein